MATRQKLTPSPGITRVDQESTRTHGWVGRVGYRRTDAGWRPQFTSFFGDRSHGSSAEALKAAEKWLRATKRQAGEGAGAASKTARGGRAAGAKKAAAKKSSGRKAAAKKSPAKRSAR